MPRYNVDPSHSSVTFSVRHMVISKVRGAFTTFSGSVEYDAASPASSTVTASIDTASIDTHEEKRDAHLKSPDFFDVAKFPTITFTSRQVESGGEGLKVTGDLTIHGVTKTVVLETEALGGGKDPWGGERVGFSAHTSINRKDFGLGWNQALETGGVLVGEKIEITLDIQAVKA